MDFSSQQISTLTHLMGPDFNIQFSQKAGIFSTSLPPEYRSHHQCALTKSSINGKCTWHFDVWTEVKICLQNLVSLAVYSRGKSVLKTEHDGAEDGLVGGSLSPAL